MLEFVALFVSVLYAIITIMLVIMAMICVILNVLFIFATFIDSPWNWLKSIIYFMISLFLILPLQITFWVTLFSILFSFTPLKVWE